jgi:TPR repeat protein
MSGLCKWCNINDVLEGYEQGVCPFCGELYCWDCMKPRNRQDMKKCPNCKIPLRMSEKKVSKALEKLRVKYLNLKKSRPLDKKESLVLVAALNCLTDRFITGVGIQVNYHLAREMCLEVMELENPTGYYNLYHLISDTNPEEAIKLLRKSVELGFNKAMLILAMEIRIDNGEQHNEESEKLLKQAALTGLSEAEYQLALACHLGELSGEDPKNTERNQKRALFWYKRAADKNHGPALNNLGLFHREGKGCIGNASKALEYFVKSMNLGCREGGHGAGIIYEEGGDYKMASHCYSQASLLGCKNAMFRLGLLIITEKVTDPISLDGNKPSRRECLTQGLNMVKDAAGLGLQEAIEYLETIAGQLAEIKAGKRDSIKTKQMEIKIISPVEEGVV